MEITLQPMTRERMHELYRGFVFDPDIFMDMELYEKNKNYVYDERKVDALFDMRSSEEGSTAFAVMLDGRVIGEVGLRHADPETGECELSIHLQNDSVKNKVCGTQAEKQAVAFAFETLGLRAVLADAVKSNARSRHVLEKVGFIPCGEDESFVYYRIERPQA